MSANNKAETLAIQHADTPTPAADEASAILRSVFTQRAMLRLTPEGVIEDANGLMQALLGDTVGALAVQRSGQWVGFVVPRLRAIERVQWAPARSALASALGADRVALVDGAAAQRSLHVVDLQALAARVLGEAPAEAAATGQPATADAV